jgi:hypothetical protein
MTAGRDRDWMMFGLVWLVGLGYLGSICSSALRVAFFTARCTPHTPAWKRMEEGEKAWMMVWTVIGGAV